VSTEAETRFRELLAYAQEDDTVLGLFVIGSRRREGFGDGSSDYDVGVVVRDEALEAFDARWPYEHGSSVVVGDAKSQREVVLKLERVARERGLGDVFDSWEPDVGWLRGDEAYRRA
jgi:predicted nucleotidyltransferase